MNSTSRSGSRGLPFAGIACFIAVVLCLLLAAERSGLPSSWTQPLSFAVLGLVVVLAVLMSRAASEPVFFGGEELQSRFYPGLLLGFIITGIIFSAFGGVSVHGGPQNPEPFSAFAGALIGLFGAHLMARRWRARPSQVQTMHGRYPRFIHFVLGVALIIAGGILALLSLQPVLEGLAHVFGKSGGEALIYALMLPFLAVLLGGAYGGLMLSCMLLVVSLAGLVIISGIGFNAFGAPPLPGFSDMLTLTVISELRMKWGLTKGLFPMEWPSLAAVFAPSHLGIVAVSAGLTAAIAISLSPAIAIRRRSVGLMAMIATCLLPLVLIASGGYAVEAAAKQFVGASINRPPAGLLESIRLGLASVCGGTPETADALRVQCGALPRDASTLAVEQMRFTDAFLQGGLPVALGFSSVVNVLARVAPLAVAGIGLTMGLWMMTMGLGNHILGRRHQAAGLASQRLAVMRMATVLATGAVAVAAINASMLSLDQIMVLAGLAAVVIVGANAWLLFKMRTESCAALSKETVDQKSSKRVSPSRGRRKLKPSALGEGT
ncbi:MAG: hypothetical protein ACKVON_17435 [Beijerinckiaceae bacterium]